MIQWMEEAFVKACEDGIIPGAVFMAMNRDDKLTQQSHEYQYLEYVQLSS